jgi:[Skp1-protein]-hydroxyproline N-acetylglucosaminyltransferase
MEVSDTIFVGIPSYRDSECQHTVTDMFNKAARPNRIFVGICFQYSKEEDSSFFDHFPKEYESQITIEHVPHTEATGPCWARYITQKLYKNQKYYLSLDSHMRFEQNWDQTLIQLLAKCGTPEKSILTSYPPSYELPNIIHRDTNPIFTCAKEFGADGMLRLVGKELKFPLLKPKLALFWISGFAFSYATVINEVLYDPNLPFLFFGEESSMSVRLWTSGWDFYAPGVNIVYHLWERKHRPNFRENSDLENKLEKKSQQRIRFILGVDDHCDEEFDLKYGRGTVRTLTEYEDFAGVNFKEKILGESTKLGGLPQNYFKEDIMNLILSFANSLK